MGTNKYTRTLLALLILAMGAGNVSATPLRDLTALDIRHVKVEGEIGRRIDITVNNNILAADVDRDFLLPFKERNRQGGYIGLGKFIDRLARFAAYTGDERVLALKKHVVAETLRTQEAGETCATAYLLRWLDALLQIEGGSLYGDIMERGICNGLFAAQSPDGHRLRYCVPFEGAREYFPRDTYCRPCNLRRIIAELPGMVFYRGDGGAVIILYAQSSTILGEVR